MKILIYLEISIRSKKEREMRETISRNIKTKKKKKQNIKLTLIMNKNSDSFFYPKFQQNL